MRVYGLSGKDVTGALGSFAQDSQEGTKFSRKALRQGQGDQESNDFEAAEVVVRGYGLKPNPHLPGELLESEKL